MTGYEMNGNGIIIDPEDGQHIAELCEGAILEQGMLLAAAPELLAALRECAKQLRLLDCGGHAAIAENAIAKATRKAV